MKEGIVVGCLLKVVAMASDDEGFTLTQRDEQAQSGSLWRSDTPHTCLMGLSGARLPGQETSGSFGPDYVHNGGRPTSSHVNQKEKIYSQSQSEHRPKAGAVD